MRRARPAALAALLTVAMTTGCSHMSLFEDTFVESGVNLPGTATAMAVLGPDVVIGTYDDAAHPRAGLVRVLAGGTAIPIEVRANSPYAFDGRWRSLAGADGALVGLTGISGGAHGNVRWAIWRGNDRVVTEEPQTFETFAGIDAGALSAVARDRDGPLVAGSWKSASTGLDAAVWRPRGTRWVRESSTGTPLASSPEALVQVSAAANTPGGSVLAGSVTALRGSPAITATIWTRDASGDWVATRLPLSKTSVSVTAGGLSTGVEAISCRGARCLAAGRVNSRLRFWSLSVPAHGPIEVSQISSPSAVTLPPDRNVFSDAVPDDARIAGLALGRAHGWAAIALPGDAGVVWRATLPTTGNWRARWWPYEAPHTPTALAAVADTVWLTTSEPGEPSVLWSTPG